MPKDAQKAPEETGEEITSMRRSRLGMGLDEPLSKTRPPGAGIVLIGMHRFVFTLTAAAAACLALSRAGPRGSPIDRSISFTPLA